MRGNGEELEAVSVNLTRKQLGERTSLGSLGFGTQVDCEEHGKRKFGPRESEA